jgi:hypothetical protein
MAAGASCTAPSPITASETRKASHLRAPVKTSPSLLRQVRPPRRPFHRGRRRVTR